MTIKTRMGLAAGAAAAALLAGGAALYAQDGGPRGPMAKFDADSNGAITLAEARAGAAKMFGGADADKDGRVTSEEMRAFHGKDGHHRDNHGGRSAPGHDGRPGGPLHFDADGDGAVTLAEAQSGIDRHFGEIDSNRDGSLTAAELRAAHEAHRR